MQAISRLNFELSVMSNAGVTKQRQKNLNSWMAETKNSFAYEFQCASISTQGKRDKNRIQEYHLSNKGQFVQKMLLKTMDT